MTSLPGTTTTFLIGWPLTVFLMPDGTPFFGGTYYPPEDRGQMPGFPRILAAVIGSEIFLTMTALPATSGGARARDHGAPAVSAG